MTYLPIKPIALSCKKTKQNFGSLVTIAAAVRLDHIRPQWLGTCK